MKVTNVRPYINAPLAEFDEVNEAVDKYNFRLTDITAYKYPNGFISVVVNWSSSGDMKCAIYGGKSSACDASSILLVFPNAKYQYEGSSFDSNFSFGVGLQIDESHEQNPALPRMSLHVHDEIAYQVTHFQNLGYGAQVWFAPKGWDKGGVAFVEEKIP